MRIIRFLIFYVLVTVMGLMALIFLGLNHFTIRLDLLNAQYSVSVAWVIVGAAAFGFVIALLLLLPGRLATGIHARSLERELRYLERQLDESEYLLEDREELRARLLAQHEALMERHERMLLRHQALVTDHSHALAERDDARAQLSALRISRPSSMAAHISGAATALRLLPPAKQTPAEPVPITRPATPAPATPAPATPAPATPAPARPTPAAQVAATPTPTPAAAPVAIPASATETQAEPIKPPAVEPVEPKPAQWRLIASKPDIVEAGPAPASVPVVSTTAGVAASPASVKKQAQKAKKAAATTPPAWRRLLATLQTRGAHTRQATRALFARLRRGIVAGWSSVATGITTGWHRLAAWITTQATTQRARLHQLWQRLVALRATRDEA